MLNSRLLGNIFDPQILLGERSGTFRDSGVGGCSVEYSPYDHHCLLWTCAQASLEYCSTGNFFQADNDQVRPTETKLLPTFPNPSISTWCPGPGVLPVGLLGLLRAQEGPAPGPPGGAVTRETVVKLLKYTKFYFNAVNVSQI